MRITPIDTPPRSAHEDREMEPLDLADPLPRLGTGLLGARLLQLAQVATALTLAQRAYDRRRDDQTGPLAFRAGAAG